MLQKIIYLGISLALSLMEGSTFAAHPAPTQAKSAMVVSAQHYATQVGTDILNQGGNAIDAAVAVGYALAVVHPCCGNIGGGGFMLIRLHSGKAIFLDFRETAPAALTSNDLFKNNHLMMTRYNKNYLVTGVPGTVLGLNTALKRYGTMSLKQVMAPAIKLAKQGFRVDVGDQKIFNILAKDNAKLQPNVKAIFLPNGKAPRIGSLLKQPQLATTLSSIAKLGSQVFYHGNIAKQVVNASQQQGGKLTLADFVNYKVSIKNPISCDYRGYQIITAPPPSSGVTLCEILNIVQHYPLAKQGFHSAQSIRENIEAMQYAYQDRSQYIGEGTNSHILKTLLSAKHAKAIAEKISANQWVARKPALKDNEKLQTTHYSITDKQGNAVAVTYTLNGFFGNRRIAGNTGFFLNNEMADFSATGVNNINAGKRPRSSMSPTIILHHGKLAYVLGTPGGSTIITQLAEAIENLVDYKMNISQAVNACRYHSILGDPRVFNEPYCFSPDTQRLLSKMGYQVIRGYQPYPKYHEPYWGAMAGIAYHDGWYYGAMDVRRPAGLAQGIGQ